MTGHLGRPAPLPPMLPSRTLIDHLGLSRGRCRDVLSLQLPSTATSSDSITISNLLPPKLERGVRVFYHQKRWPPIKAWLVGQTTCFRGRRRQGMFKKGFLPPAFPMFWNVSKCFGISLITPKCKSTLMSLDFPCPLLMTLVSPSRSNREGHILFYNLEWSSISSLDIAHDLIFWKENASSNDKLLSFTFISHNIFTSAS